MSGIIDVYKLLFGRKGIADGNVIDLAEHGRVGGTSVDQAFKFTSEPPMNLKVTISGSYTYVGESAPGTDQSTAKWRCKKIDESVAGTTVTTWADNGNFSQTATDLTALSYS